MSIQSTFINNYAHFAQDSQSAVPMLGELMHIELPPDLADRIHKLRQVIEAIGFDISLQELVEKTLEDGLEVAVYKLSLALPEDPPDAA